MTLAQDCTLSYVFVKTGMVTPVRSDWGRGPVKALLQKLKVVSLFKRPNSCGMSPVSRLSDKSK